MIAYKAAAVSQDTFDFGTTKAVSADLDQAIKAADHLVSQWRSKAKASKVYVCLTGDTNFRKEVDPEYKANRKGLAKPVNLIKVKDYLKEKYPFLLTEGLEADDLMGIYSTSGEYGQSIIVSTDKDMQSVPGLLLNPDKMSRPVKISTAAANRYWFTQTLTGDTVDNFKGCPQVGPVKAAQIINSASSFGDCWSRIVEAFEDAGLSEADALRNARLARILRAGEFNPNTMEVKLWHPTQSVALRITPTAKSKSSTTSSKSADTTPETKPRTSPTSSSTSVALPTRRRKSKTSRKHENTSTC